MTRGYANELLFLWKVGAQLYPPHVITQALYVTGDLDGPNLEAEPRLVRVPSPPAWLEGTSLALGQRTGKRTPVDVLATAGVAGQSNGEAA